MQLAWFQCQVRATCGPCPLQASRPFGCAKHSGWFDLICLIEVWAFAMFRLSQLSESILEPAKMLAGLLSPKFFQLGPGPVPLNLQLSRSTSDCSKHRSRCHRNGPVAVRPLFQLFLPESLAEQKLVHQLDDTACFSHSELITCHCTAGFAAFLDSWRWTGAFRRVPSAGFCRERGLCAKVGPAKRCLDRTRIGRKGW